jgi:hypothetical protein
MEQGFTRIGNHDDPPAGQSADGSLLAQPPLPEKSSGTVKNLTLKAKSCFVAPASRI